MITLLEFAARAVRVPFVKRGRSYDGWDCWGLIYVAYRDVLGKTIYDGADQYDDTGSTPRSREQLNELFRANMAEWSRVDGLPRPTDVALFNVAGRPLHVGLMLDQRRMLHCEEKIGTFVERIDGAAWARRLEGIYRHVG